MNSQILRGVEGEGILRLIEGVQQLVLGKVRSPTHSKAEFQLIVEKG